MSKIVIIDPDLDERSLDGYYFQTYFCDNCGHPASWYKNTIDVMVKQGNPRPLKLKCPNCKLETLK